MMRKYLPIVLASFVSITALSSSYFQKTGLIVQPTVTTTSAGTLTLVATSNQVHVFSGSTTHTLQLPDATLLYSGWFYEVSNDSTATVTIAQSDLSALFQLASSTWAKIWLTSNASATGNWKYKTSGAATGGGTPGGADTQIQYNAAGSFGAESDLVYFATSNRVGIGTSTPDGPLDVIEFASNDAAYITLPNATPSSASLSNKQWTVSLDDTNDTFEFKAKDGTGNVISRSLGGAGSSVAGSDTQVQFNDGGIFGAESTFTYDKTNNRLTAEEITSSGGGSGATSERFGTGVAGTGANQVVLGTNADGGSTDDNITIGKTSTAGSGAGQVLIGSTTSGSFSGVAVGFQAVSHRESVAIGSAAAANDTATGKNVAVGASSVISNGASANIALGANIAITSGNNQAVVGSETAPITQVYIGEGITSTTPSPMTIQGTGGSGTDISASTFTLGTGKGTGNASAPTMVFNVATPNSVSGTSLQSLMERFRIGRTVEYPQEIVTPTSPAAGYTRLYSKNDGNLYQLTPAGVETNLASASSTPGGSDTQIQYNNAGAFGAESALVYFATSNRVGIGTSTPDGPLDVIEFASNDAVYLTLPNATPNSATLAVKQWSVSLDDAGDTFEFIGKDGLGNVVQRSLGASGSGSGEAIEKSVTQASHGFAVGDVAYFDGSTYELAKADVDATSEVLGVVNAVADVNNFTLTMAGYISGLSGLSAGTTYYLSASSAGDITATEPSGAGEVSKPVLVAVSTTAAYVLQSRGAIIESGGGGISPSGIYCTGGNGLGGSSSGETNVRNFTTCTTTGTDVTRTARTTTAGDKFTVNTTGTYVLSISDAATGGGTAVGFTVNGTDLSNTPSTPITFANGARCGWTQSGAANVAATISCNLYLTATDVVRFMATGNFTNDTTTATIYRAN